LCDLDSGFNAGDVWFSRNLNGLFRAVGAKSWISVVFQSVIQSETPKKLAMENQCKCFKSSDLSCAISLNLIVI
jgi:hypothetical protein